MPDQITAYDKGVQELFRGASKRTYPKNQLIQYQGDPFSHIYLIKKGFNKVYTILDSGDTRTFLILGPGDIFPMVFSSTLDWKDYSLQYFYQSLTEIELLVLEREEFKHRIDTNAEKRNIYIAYLAASNEVIMRQLEVMKSKKAITKVRRLLPYLIIKLGKQIKPHAYQLQIKISHQEIADLSGVTRETTTTLIKKLEKQGQIEQKKGKWIIHAKDSDKELFHIDKPK